MLSFGRSVETLLVDASDGELDDWRRSVSVTLHICVTESLVSIGNGKSYSNFLCRKQSSVVIDAASNKWLLCEALATQMRQHRRAIEQLQDLNDVKVCLSLRLLT